MRKPAKRAVARNTKYIQNPWLTMTARAEYASSRDEFIRFLIKRLSDKSVFFFNQERVEGEIADIAGDEGAPERWREAAREYLSWSAVPKGRLVSRIKKLWPGGRLENRRKIPVPDCRYEKKVRPEVLENVTVVSKRDHILSLTPRLTVLLVAAMRHTHTVPGLPELHQQINEKVFAGFGEMVEVVEVVDRKLGNYGLKLVYVHCNPALVAAEIEQLPYVRRVTIHPYGT